eukprot:gene24576-32008_t
MDRGRVGLDASGNKAIRDYVLKSRKQEHFDRIQSIMNRPPGSSTTLDNRPPNLINALATNPKQKALKRDFNKITGRENKAMLKRIGKILTAPPLHTESDYERQKKKVPKEHTRRLEKLQLEIKKKAKLYFDQLKKTHGLYNVKDWENDYKKQLFHQKYIRQVNYQRPKDFIDPISIEPVNNKQITTSPNKHHNSSAHINRIRNIKSNSLSSDKEYKDESVTYSDSYENEYEEYAFDNDWDNVKAKTNDLSIEDAIDLMTAGTDRKTISTKTIELPIWSVKAKTVESPNSDNNSPRNLRALASFYKVEDKPLDVVKAEVTALVLGEEDEVNITAKIITSSKLTFNNHKILSVDSQLMSTTGLPSIVHIDPDLMNEFLQSIAEHLLIQFDKQTGQCSLILTSY